jgi:hypothetical protein
MPVLSRRSRRRRRRRKSSSPARHAGSEGAERKRRFMRRHFLRKKRSFAKTGSAQACESALKFGVTAGRSRRLHRCEKRHFLSHLYIKCVFLPRQARDKHRESTQKRVAFCAGAAPRRPDLVANEHSEHTSTIGRKICGPFCDQLHNAFPYETDHSAETGSGQENQNHIEMMRSMCLGIFVQGFLSLDIRSGLDVAFAGSHSRGDGMRRCGRKAVFCFWFFRAVF